MRMLIKNIRIVSPGNGLDRTGSIVISDGTILRVGDCAETDGEFDTVIDGKGLSRRRDSWMYTCISGSGAYV